MGNKVIITEEDGTTSQKGVNVLSDDPTTITGTDSTSNITPSSLKAKLGTQDIGKIAIGAGVSEIIKWAKAQSSDYSINITYDPDANTLDFKATSSGDVRSICISENPGFTEGVEFAEPVCIIPTSDGELNFTADPPIILTSTPNGLNISFSGSGSGIQTINTTAPDESDDFKIIATLPYIFEPIANGINLKDNGSIPYQISVGNNTEDIKNNIIIFFADAPIETFLRNGNVGIRIGNASSDSRGIIYTALDRQVLDGTDAGRAVTAASLRAILGVLTANTVLISTGRETAIANSSVGTAGMPFISKGGTGLPDFGSIVSNDGTIAINYDSNTHTINLSVTGSLPGQPNVEFISGNDGVSVPSDTTTHILKFIGDVIKGVNVSKSGDNELTITISDATATQRGVVTLNQIAASITFQGDSGTANASDQIVKFLGDLEHGLQTLASTNQLQFTLLDSSPTQKGVIQIADSVAGIAGEDETLAMTPKIVQLKLGNMTKNSVVLGDGLGLPFSYSNIGQDPFTLLLADGNNPPKFVKVISQRGGLSFDYYADQNILDINAKTSKFFEASTQTFGSETNTSMQFTLEDFGRLAVYSAEIRIACSATAPSPNGNGGAFQIFACFKTDADTAYMVGSPDMMKIIEGVISAASVTLSVSGNNLVFNVTGVAPELIDWHLEMNYTVST